MSSQLALATSIGQLSQPDLELLLRERVVTNPASIRDALDLAGSLLKPESIKAGLRQSSRAELTVLAGEAAPEALTLVRRALALQSEPEGSATLMPEVTAVLQSLIADTGIDLTPTTRDQDAQPDVLEGGASEHPLARESTRHHAAERAFETVRIASQILHSLGAQPANTRSGMMLNAVSTKRVAADAAITPDEVASYVRLLLGSNLAEVHGAQCVPSASAAEWSGLSRPEQFLSAVGEWLKMLKPFVRATLVESTQTAMRIDHTFVRAYPLASKEMVLEIETFVRDAQVFGLLEAAQLTSIGRQVFGGERAAAFATLESEFPSSVHHVYVQPDLSVVAPGPLDPRAEEQLLQFAVIESAGLASSYRITARTLEASLAAGFEEEDIRAFLAEHSLTGIPQPLDYLLTEATKRHGSIVISTESNTSAGFAHTLITATEAGLIAQLSVDRELVALNLSEVSEFSLTTSHGPEEVARILRDAGYPATVSPGSAPAASGRQQPEPAGDPIGELATRVFETAQRDSEGSSIERMLELAVRQKLRVRVSLTQADGTERELLLLPVGLSNGRLRGIDEQAEIERTLPVSQLTSAHPAPKSA